MTTPSDFSSYEVFYVDKGLNPFSDLLTVFGLAKVVSSVLYEPTDNQFRLTIRDRGTCYELRCAPAVDETMLTQRIVPQKPIQTLKTHLPDSLRDVYDYEAEKEIVNSYYAAVRQNAADPLPPNSYWDVLRAINPAALPGYNALMLNWQHVTGNADVLRLLFDLFATTPNPVGAALERWQQLDRANDWGIKAEATAQQLYNPDSGKGQNRAKSNGLSVGNLDNFWLIEWLKAVGFYDGALTRLVRGAKDRKTFVIAPRELTYQEHASVVNAFIGTMQFSETATRFDILAVVRYMRALLEHFSASDSGLSRLLKSGSVKKRIVGGFYTAFYKDMGNAVATMNMAFIALPGWITVESREDVALYRALLDEFEPFVRQFDESHSDAFTLLQHLRDFVSADDLRAFFRFTNAFPAYLMGMRERNKPARQLTTSFIERLMMSSDKPLAPILESPGFQNIAYAIRQSTVVAQFRKKQGDRKYDVRYGLGQELARKARYPQEFIAALSDFLHKYNAENAQVMETRQGPYRRSIQTTDIQDIVRLIDEYGSETVANMLIAYGYAREPRDPQDDGASPDTETNQIEPMEAE
jgi:hypothetical protein